MIKRKHHHLICQKYRTFTEMTYETRLPHMYMTSNELFSSFYNLYTHSHTVSQCVGTKKKIKEFSFIFTHWHILRSTLVSFLHFSLHSHTTLHWVCFALCDIIILVRVVFIPLHVVPIDQWFNAFLQVGRLKWNICYKQYKYWEEHTMTTFLKQWWMDTKPPELSNIQIFLTLKLCTLLK
jgi:hypothetical protein